MLGMRPARAFAPVRATPRRLLEQAFRLKQQLRPGVAPAELMIAHQPVVEMPRREALIAGAVQPLDLIFHRRRDLPAQGAVQTPIDETGRSLLLVTAGPATE